MREAFEEWLRSSLPDLPPETYKWNPGIPGYQNAATDWSWKIWAEGAAWGHKAAKAAKEEK